MLFGVVYFVQGLGSPTDGLLAQPVMALLKRSGFDAGDIAAFSAVAALPWAAKPLFGLLTDSVRLAGQRRRSWLVLATGASAAPFFGLFAASATSVTLPLLLAFLLVATFGVAFADVVTDALMVEKGRPRGITGRLQAVQWTAMYAATLLAGVLVGWLAQHGRDRLGFLLSGGFATLCCALAVLAVREGPAPKGGARDWAGLRRAFTSAPLPAVAGFLALWSFNPFGNAVLYVHWTTAVGFDEEFYGTTLATLSTGALAAGLGYVFLSRRLSFSGLVHLTVLGGVGANLGYAFVDDRGSALVASFAAGFTYMTASLTQLDLAARLCPPRFAGTVFASLMAITNVSLASAGALGGRFYEEWKEALGAGTAFQVLVAAGALLTAACWSFLPWLHPAEPRSDLTLGP